MLYAGVVGGGPVDKQLAVSVGAFVQFPTVVVGKMKKKESKTDPKSRRSKMTLLGRHLRCIARKMGGWHVALQHVNLGP